MSGIGGVSVSTPESSHDLNIHPVYFLTIPSIMEAAGLQHVSEVPNPQGRERVMNPGWARLVLAAMLLCGCDGGTTETANNTASSETAAGNGTHTAGSGSLPEDAVVPTEESIEAGEYTPLSRPLYLYINRRSLDENSAAGAFLNYYLSDEGQQLVTEAGYIRLSPSQLEETVQALRDAGVPEKVTGDLSGEVVIDGSSTVAPISVAVAEEFSKLHRGVRIPVGTSGTGGGFKKFIDGTSDINDASRPIKESEVASLNENGIDFVELKVAIDGLTVVVNPENDWVAGLTVEELQKIWESGSRVHLWSDINPEWPHEELKLFGPDTDSGTFDYFTEVICGEVGASRSDYQQNADDNFLVTGVASDKYALGYFGYAYYIENKDQLKALAIAPSAE
jgi:phosphate binding protein